jgi:hypothetical protein
VLLCVFSGGERLFKTTILIWFHRAEIKPLQEEKGTADGPDSEETEGSVPSLEGWPRRVSSGEVRPLVMEFTHSRSVA